MVEQLGIDDVSNAYLPHQADVAKHVSRTRNIGVPLGERVGNHEVGAKRNKRWRDARLSNLASIRQHTSAIVACRNSALRLHFLTFTLLSKTAKKLRLSSLKLKVKTEAWILP
jgi:hypothetical protein